MLYRFLRFWVRVALRVFYKKIQVRNAAVLQTRAPVIVVSNHPNTLMDPLIIAALFPQPLFFLANASLFRGKWQKKVCNTLGLIPIYRKQDLRGATEKPNNKAIFLKCYEYLNKQASILIFPEGTSFVERRLREIKTGTARMALGAEAEQDFGLGLSIVCLGLNYSHPTNFRSEVFVSFADPISVQDFQESFLEKESKGVQKLNESIESQLSANIIVTKDQTEDELLSRLEGIYLPFLIKKMGLSETDLEKKFALTQKLLATLRFFEANEQDQTETLKEKIIFYTDTLKKERLRDSLVPVSQTIGGGELFGRGLALLLGLPLFLYGFLNSYLPYKLPSVIAQKATSEREFWAGIMMVSGLLLFSIFYAAQIGFCYLFFNFSVALFYALSLPISAFFAIFYAQKWKDLIDRLRLWKAWRQTPDSMYALLKNRKEIFEIVGKRIFD